MADMDVTFRLPKDLVERARAQGMLDDAHMARLLEAEIARQTIWQRLDNTLKPARAAFRADHPTMSEEDALEWISELISEVRQDEAKANDTRED